MAQYLIKDITTRTFAAVDDNQVESYKAEGWQEATPADIEYWKRTHDDADLKDAPPPPPLGAGGQAAQPATPDEATVRSARKG